MQDGARIHWTQASREAIAAKGMRVLDGWPPHSADLNPIENLWATLQRRVSERGPFGVKDLARYVRDEFAAVARSTTEKLAASFLERCRQCVVSRGAAVK